LGTSGGRGCCRFLAHPLSAITITENGWTENGHTGAPPPGEIAAGAGTTVMAAVDAGRSAPCPDLGSGASWWLLPGE
jgi:hypothetical protein